MPLPLKLCLLYYLFMNILLFFIMGYDKRQAIKDRRRVPEATLFLLSFLGGGLGGFLGMMTFHHKTKKMYFYLVYFIAVNVHFIILYLLLGKLLGL